MLKSMIIYFLLISSNFQKIQAPSTLKAGFGVNFQHVGQLQPSLNKRYLTLAFALPQYEPPGNYSYLKTRCPPLTGDWKFSQRSVHVICEVYRDLIENHIKERLENDKLILKQIADINSVLPIRQPSKTNREKRGLGL
jgi:hypothetical protein